MDPSGYLGVLRRHLALLLVCTLAGLALAGALAAVLPRTYQARATLFLEVRSVSASLYERNLFALQRVDSYPRLIDAPSVLQRVDDELGLPGAPSRLAARVSADNPPDTVLVEVTGVAGTPGAAAALANAAARSLSAEVEQIESGQNSNSYAVQLAPKASATPPSRASSPSVAVVLALGLLAGLAVGSSLAFLLETIRPIARTAADVRRLVGLPVVGQLPWTTVHRFSSLLPSASAREAAANLHALTQGALPRTLLLVPADAASDRPLARRLIAAGLAETGRDVALVETGFEMRHLRDTPLGPDIAGLLDVLAGRATVQEVVWRNAIGGVDLVPVGRRSSLPSRFEIERRLPAAIEEVTQRHEVVVVQAPVAGSPIDLAAVAPVGATALLVGSARRTTQRSLRRAKAQLNALGVPTAGVLLIDASAVLQVDVAESWQDADFGAASHSAPPVRAEDRSEAPVS